MTALRPFFEELQIALQEKYILIMVNTIVTSKNRTTIHKHKYNHS